VEPPTQPPIVWSDDEDDADAGPAEQANSVAGTEPRTFKHAMQTLRGIIGEKPLHLSTTL